MTQEHAGLTFTYSEEEEEAKKASETAGAVDVEPAAASHDASLSDGQDASSMPAPTPLPNLDGPSTTESDLRSGDLVRETQNAAHYEGTEPRARDTFWESRYFPAETFERHERSHDLPRSYLGHYYNRGASSAHNPHYSVDRQTASRDFSTQSRIGSSYDQRDHQAREFTPLHHDRRSHVATQVSVAPRTYDYVGAGHDTFHQPAPRDHIHGHYRHVDRTFESRYPSGPDAGTYDYPASHRAQGEYHSRHVYHERNPFGYDTYQNEAPRSEHRAYRDRDYEGAHELRLPPIVSAEEQREQRNARLPSIRERSQSPSPPSRRSTLQGPHYSMSSSYQPTTRGRLEYDSYPDRHSIPRRLDVPVLSQPSHSQPPCREPLTELRSINRAPFDPARDSAGRNPAMESTRHGAALDE